MKRYIALLISVLVASACSVPDDNEARTVEVPASLQRTLSSVAPTGCTEPRKLYFVRTDNELLEARSTNVACPAGVAQLIDALVNAVPGPGYRTSLPRSTTFFGANPNDAGNATIDLGIRSLSTIGVDERRAMYQQIVFTIAENTPYVGVIFVVNGKSVDDRDVPGLRNPIAAGNPISTRDYEPNTIFTTTTTSTTPPTTAPPPTTGAPPSTGAPAASIAPPPPSATTR